MKKSLLFLSILLITCTTFAQSPNEMSYQAVIRNSAGVLVANSPVGMRVRILHKTDIGNSVYVETHSGTTNANGLLTIKIGVGSVVSGNYNVINWSDGPYFLQTEIDPNGGTNYSAINNVSQMLSVPYALYAKTSGSTITPDSTLWTLNGNSVNPSAFIGTINNQPLQMKVNNILSGFLSNWNTAIGYESFPQMDNGGAANTAFGVSTLHGGAGSANTAIGFEALKNNLASFNTATGKEALYSNTTGGGNTAMGVTALYANTTGEYNSANSNMAMYSNISGSRNTALGAEALTQNTSGNANIAIGYRALRQSVSGSNQIAIGDSALMNNTTGKVNMAMGSKALFKNSIGNENLAVGYYSLHDNTAGHSNVGLGYSTLRQNISGSENVAIGHRALTASTTASNNTAVGSSALSKNTTGLRNVAVGFYALENNYDGSENTAIGYWADVAGESMKNSTAIGFAAKVTASNRVQIGNSNVTTVQFGNIATTKIYAHSLVTPSDERFKYNIQNNVPGLDFIRELKPVTYNFDSDKLNEYTTTGIINNRNVRPVSYNGQDALHTGFLAQDVEKIAIKLGYSFDGVHTPDGDKDHYSLSYSKFIMPMVKAIQEQQDMIEQQSSVTILQQKTIEKLQETIEKLEQKLEALSNK